MSFTFIFYQQNIEEKSYSGKPSIDNTRRKYVHCDSNVCRSKARNSTFLPDINLSSEHFPRLSVAPHSRSIQSVRLTHFHYFNSTQVEQVRVWTIGVFLQSLQRVQNFNLKDKNSPKCPNKLHSKRNIIKNLSHKNKAKSSKIYSKGNALKKTLSKESSSASWRHQQRTERQPTVKQTPSKDTSPTNTIVSVMNFFVSIFPLTSIGLTKRLQ